VDLIRIQLISLVSSVGCLQFLWLWSLHGREFQRGDHPYSRRVWQLLFLFHLWVKGSRPRRRGAVSDIDIIRIRTMTPAVKLFIFIFSAPVLLSWKSRAPDSVRSQHLQVLKLLTTCDTFSSPSPPRMIPSRRPRLTSSTTQTPSPMPPSLMGFQTKFMRISRNWQRALTTPKSLMTRLNSIK